MKKHSKNLFMLMFVLYIHKCLLCLLTKNTYIALDVNGDTHIWC